MGEFDFIWKGALIIFAGFILLRIAGRKSISQMTIGTTVIMISIGTLIVQPLANRSIWKAIAIAVIFIAFLLIVEYLQLKFNVLEKLFSGSAKIVIQNGQPHEGNLKKLRFTVDKLEMRLRQNGISRISDVKTATLEPNGMLGYELKRYAQPVTYGDLEKLFGTLVPNQSTASNIFDEVEQGGHSKKVPTDLQ
jgi:uncharacterized membrane protein YcaP (DUF421 family)